jgi:hypothetical protein
MNDDVAASDRSGPSERPTTGLRIVLEREDSAGDLRYVGQILSPAETLAVEAQVGADGAVAVTVERAEPADLDPGRRAALVEKVRLLVRTLVRQAASDDLTPPRRINRWRE